MKKNYLLIAVVFTYLAVNVNAQAPNWLWAKGIAGTVGASWTIAVDGASNSYITGSFSGTADFDPGGGIFNLTSLGGDDIFILKLDASGNFAWAKQMGGPGDQYGYTIVLDASGNIYTSGQFIGTSDFDPGTGIFNITSAGNDDIFISKLSSSGNFIWAKSIGGPNDEFVKSMVVDPSGNIYSTGSISGTTDFDPGAGTYNLTSAGFIDIFLSKLDSSGNFGWAKRMGASDNDLGQSIALDPSAYGNIYITGDFHDTVDFDPGTGLFNLVANGTNTDMFISKFDSSGNFVWAKGIGGINYDDGHSIVPDGAGNLYITGWFFGTTDFDPGAGVFYLASQGNNDVYILKTDTSGNFKWVKRMGGVDYQSGYSIVFDPSGNGAVYYEGRFAGTPDFDPGTGIFNMTSGGLNDIYISKLDTSGSFLWAKAIAGTGDEYCESMVLDASGNAYITGFTTSASLAFDSTALPNARIFIARLDTTIITGNNLIENNGSSILLFPNPVANHLTITLGSNRRNVEVIVTDITAKIIYTTTASETQKIEVSTKDFSEGIYIVRIKAADFIETKKIIVVK